MPVTDECEVYRLKKVTNKDKVLLRSLIKNSFRGVDEPVRGQTREVTQKTLFEC